MVFLIILVMASLKFSSLFSSSSANIFSVSATAVFITVLESAIEKAEPSILNSNLLPVNAKGEVRFLSVLSLGSWGMTCTPISTLHFALRL